MSEVREEGLSALLHETRTFPPPEALAKRANAQPGIYDEAKANPHAFWASQAEHLTWATPWTDVLDWSNAPFAKWFVGGRLNVAVNCVDRHVDAGLGDRVAFHWEGEPGDTRTITYRDLLASVSQAANALIELGVKTGDKVAIYMPMIPETVVAMLACARLGAPHTVVFGGFSSDALRGRILDCDAHFVITADGGYRRGAASSPQGGRRRSRRSNAPTSRRFWWCGAPARTWRGTRAATCGGTTWSTASPTRMRPRPSTPSTRLYIMYTSGTTAKPKGILHTSGGYLTHVSATHRLIFDIKPDEDVYWTAADIGWVTGHSYIVYGPLANATTSVMYEGTPDTPARDRWWQIVEKYKVNILYTAPTTIRTFMKWGEDLPAGHDLSSLRLLGSVGEPINPEAWIWYRTHIGRDNCPIVDTWWQTETGGILITPLPGITATKPGAAMTPFPGISADIIDNDGRSVGNDEGGYLVITEPWPGMLRGIYGDPERYKETYWSRFPGRYFAGDGAKRDQDGDIWLLGRVDDVMNISGHRISTTEVEHALVSHPQVAEAAVVGASDATTGQAIVAFVTVKGTGFDDDADGEKFVQELRDHVAHEIGPIAKPRQIILTPELPKTRSGKIMRRLLRDVSEHRELGDVTTLMDPTVVNAIKEGMASGAEDKE